MIASVAAKASTDVSAMIGKRTFLNSAVVPSYCHELLQKISKTLLCYTNIVALNAIGTMVCKIITIELCPQLFRRYRVPVSISISKTDTQ
jgi:hypothetical protein